MNTIVEAINAAGRAFVDFSLPMLIQSSVLILILLAVDAVLRRRVRAVFRYWIWMLVLVKLVLPPSLGSPISVGTWFGDRLEVPTASLVEPEPVPVPDLEPQGQEPLPIVSDIVAPSDSMIAQPGVLPRASMPAPMEVPKTVVSLSWQGFVLLAWSLVVIALTLLLVQRAFFVRGLVAQAEETNLAMLSELEDCRRRLGLHGRIGLRLSPNATSPAVCGLVHPTILVPQSLAPRLHSHDLQAVLLHELAHVKRGDLWINLAQTLLQIAYFYNPLLWLANAMIRRAREQAVDETVLVAMGETARQYPEILVNIAKLAFTRRPALSLRLIGVVESKSALTARIKHILSRPIPKTARLGFFGLLFLFVTAAVLLPMAGAEPGIETPSVREIVLPDVDHKAVMLDLANGQLVAIPRVGPQPQKIQEALRKRGKGDVLYDVDLGDRSLILLRDAVSEQAQEDTGEPGVKGHFVGANLPEVLTVTTAEGRRYEVTILSADEEGCTLKYSLMALDKDAGGGALAEPATTDAKPSDSGLVARLANGVTITLLAYSQLGEKGLEWWTPQGERTTIPGVYEADVEGHGAILALRIEPEPEYVLARYYQPPDVGRDLKIWRMDGSNTWLAALGQERNYVNVEVYARVKDPPAVHSVSVKQKDDQGVIQIGAYGSRITELRAVDSDTTRIAVSSMTKGPRVVAVLDTSDRIHPVRYIQTIPVPAGERETQELRRYEADVLLDDLAGIAIEGIAARGGSVKFRNILLTGGQPAQIRIEIAPEGAPMWFGSDLSSVLTELGDALSTYAGSHASWYPADESTLHTLCSDQLWRCLQEHVVYLVAGKTSAVPAQTALAYVKTLLPFGFGTYVLYSYGNVKFEVPLKLKELGIPAGGTSGRVGGTLEFRVAAKWGSLDSAPIERYQLALVNSKNPPGADFAWFPSRVSTTGSSEVSVQEHGGATYVLLWNKPPHVILASQDWGLDKVYRTTDAMGKPAIGLTLNDKGAALVRDITAANVGRPLAILVDGQVVSMPHIMSPLDGKSALITGNFTEREVADMMAALRKGMEATRPPAEPGEKSDAGEKTPFSIHGTVTDQSGRPMAGVEIAASCGVGTLLPTGRTVTDEAGRYTLYFKPGFVGHEVLPQAATISARKPGFYEANLYRQGNLAMAGKPPRPEDVAHYVGVVLPDQPYELNFTMRPAARIEGELVDERGKPLSAQTLWLNGNERYPSTSVLATIQTDETGRFTVESVPLEAVWFEGPRPSRVQSDSIDFATPGTWQVCLECPSNGARLTIANVQPPASSVHSKSLGRYVLSFDGADDCLVVPASPSLRLKPPFSIEVWGKPDFSELNRLYETNANAAKTYWLYQSLIRQGNKIEKGEGIQDGGFQVFISPARGKKENWTASLYDAAAGGRLAQVDLVEADRLVEHTDWFHLSAVFERQYHPPSPDAPLVIGENIVKAPQGLAFKGEIVEIRIWNKALTDAEARWSRSTPLTGNEPNLIACWTFDEGSGQIVHDISPNGNHAYLGNSRNTDAADPVWVDLHADQNLMEGISGRVVDPNGRPAAGAQVALCSKDKGAIIRAGQLTPTNRADKSSEIVQTDAQGRFSFASAPEEFHLIAAHDVGFAWVTSEELRAAADLRLAPWARIEGTLKIGQAPGADERVELFNYINKNAIDQNVRFDYQSQTDAAGRFVFTKVPPGWMEIGYMIRVGDSSWSDTCRTPIQLQPGQNMQMTLGGQGRQVIGKLIPPANYKGPIYFGAGLRAFSTSRRERPQPDNYDQMTQREQSEWLKQWLKTPEARAYYDAIWRDLNRRHYTFRIQDDGSFRIEDVTPGNYELTVWLEEEESLSSGGPAEFGSYHGTVEVPPMAQTYGVEPLDVGDLVLKIRPLLHVGDTAPLFEARTLDGKDIRLADYRGRFVLLAFWSPVFHPELARLKELHATYGGTGRLQIIGLGGTDTLDEVRKYAEEQRIEWPEVYFGPDWDAELIKQLGGQMQIMLIDPEGKIVATWLREEKLTNTVRDAITAADPVKKIPSAPVSIQQKIDAAAPGDTIRLEAGTYHERLRIDKPLTLEGAGWDKTTVMMESHIPESREQAADLAALSVLAVVGTRDVTIRGIQFTAPGRRVEGRSLPIAIVSLSQCGVRLSDCAVIGGPGDGIHVFDQSNAAIQRCLVAAVWGIGVRVGSNKDVSETHIEDSDIRNCHYAGIRIAKDNRAAIERCRVSGAAWHGIRYDDASPLISGNLIFSNARSGIYASGQTQATIKGNLFYANEMTGMSCWFQDKDLIEGNTFSDNKGSGLAILGASKPSVRSNIFHANPAGVSIGDIGDDSPFAKSDGAASLENNLFWANERAIQRTSDTGAAEAVAIDEKAGVAVDPRFAAPDAKDFSLKADSPARQKGVGAADLLPFASPWPLQPEELAIIPQGDSRDSRQWRDPPLP